MDSSEGQCHEAFSQPSLMGLWGGFLRLHSYCLLGQGMVGPLGLTQIPSAELGRPVLPPTLPDDRAVVGGMEPGPEAQIFFLASQKDGVASAEATNGKPPRDLSFQDTGKGNTGKELGEGDGEWEGEGQRRTPATRILEGLL